MSLPVPIGIIVALVLGSLSAPVAAHAQPPGRTYRVGILDYAPSPREEVFRQALRELGYVEGQNVILDRRFGPEDQFPRLAAELVALKLDIIVTGSTPATRAAKQATTTIPIVFATAGDPVGSRFVASLAQPGGNITGLADISPELAGKRLGLLKEVVPALRRVAALANPTHPFHAQMMSGLEDSARALKVQLKAFEVRDPGDLDKAFSAMTREPIGALLVLPHPVFFGQRKRLAEFTARARLPSSTVAREYVEAGSLMSYGTNFTDLWRRAAIYVDKILKGAKPADLPVEQPTPFELVINLKTAKALGLTIPQTILLRADQVIP